jgi:hypothetical protein
MPVRALRAAIVAGLIAGIYLGFVVVVMRYRPPEDYHAATLQLVLAPLGIGLAGGVLAALVTGLTVRATRPIWQPRPRRRDGTAAIRRLGVTLLAPVALIVLQHLWLPGIKDVALEQLIDRGGGPGASIVNLASVGISPILAAFVLVELAMLATAPGRRARYRPGARIAIGRHVGRLGVVLAAIQSYFVVSYLDGLGRSGLEIVAPGTAIRLALMAALTAGTMLMVGVAGLIRRHGLGNGYGALIVSSWAIAVVPPIVGHPTAGHALGGLTLVIIGGVAMALLRMRVGGGGEASLRVPASGSIPLVIASSVVPRLWSFAQLGVISGSGVAARWVASVPRAGLFVAGMAVLVPLWSFAFSRPGGIAPLAVRAGLSPPGRSVWRRATCLSFVSLLGLGVLAQVSAAIAPDAQRVCEASAVMMVAALVLDMLDDARARGAALVAVWPLHQAQHAELVRRVLWNAGIDCHLPSCHLRALLGWFGPYAPIDVLVAAKDAEAARDRIGGLYDAQLRKRVSG